MASFARLLSVMTVMLMAYSANAAESDDVADVQCMVVAFKLMSSGKPDLRSAGLLSAVYYIGRLDARSPNADIETLVVRQAATMTDAEFSAEAKRCGSALSQKGQEITRIGQAIIARAQGEDKQAPTQNDHTSEQSDPNATGK